MDGDKVVEMFLRVEDFGSDAAVLKLAPAS
jgi:hypothetical protein